MYMLAGLKGAAWIRLAIWVVIGVIIYFAYGIWSSKMRQETAGAKLPGVEPDKSKSIQIAKKST